MADRTNCSPASRRGGNPILLRSLSPAVFRLAIHFEPLLTWVAEPQRTGGSSRKRLMVWQATLELRFKMTVGTAPVRHPLGALARCGSEGRRSGGTSPRLARTSDSPARPGLFGQRNADRTGLQTEHEAMRRTPRMIGLSRVWRSTRCRTEREAGQHVGLPMRGLSLSAIDHGNLAAQRINRSRMNAHIRTKAKRSQ
jgi:hypothetical protein